MALLLALFLVTASSITAIAAQDDATPEAEGNGGGEANLDPVVGDPVSVLDEEGEEMAIITVDEYIDPFENYDEFTEPESGTRIVAAVVTVENSDTDDDVYEADAFDFGLQDSRGFFWQTTFVGREVADPPDLETTEVEPGDSLTGMTFFVVPEDVDSVRLFYTGPESGRLILLADLR